MNYKLDTVSAILKLPSLVGTEYLHITSSSSDCILFPDPFFLDLALSRIARSEQMLTSIPNKEVKHPLGRYFERAVEVALKAACPFLDVRSNVNITTQGGEGELDFVVNSLTSTLHLEVALKFFLYRPEPGKVQLSHFHGPQMRDRLDLKLNKLIHSQLQKKVPNELLAAGDPKDLLRGVWIAGILFYPLRMFQEKAFPDCSHSGLNPLHQKAWWARPHEVQTSIGNNQREIFSLPKSHWFRPLKSFDADEFERFRLSGLDLESLTEPVYSLIVDSNGPGIGRGFIVPENW